MREAASVGEGGVKCKEHERERERERRSKRDKREGEREKEEDGDDKGTKYTLHNKSTSRIHNLSLWINSLFNSRLTPSFSESYTHGLAWRKLSLMNKNCGNLIPNEL